MDYPQWQWNTGTLIWECFVIILILIALFFIYKYSKLHKPIALKIDGRKLKNIKRIKKHFQVFFLAENGLAVTILTFISFGLGAYPFTLLAYSLGLFGGYTLVLFKEFEKYMLKPVVKEEDFQKHFINTLYIAIIGGALSGYASRYWLFLNPIEDALITSMFILFTTFFLIYSDLKIREELSSL